jgi:hypothetical protein
MSLLEAASVQGQLTGLTSKESYTSSLVIADNLSVMPRRVRTQEG